MTETVRVERDGRVATITLDRPPLNILDLATIRSLRLRLAELAAEDGLQLAVLRAAGGRAFSVGVAVEDHTPDKVPAMLEEFHGAVVALRELPAVTLAVVQGHCLGGGMELAAGCDLVLAAESSRFAQPEIELGCFPPLAAALYPATLGEKKTFDLLLTGRSLSAAEAEELGFVSRRVADGELETETRRIVEQITAKSQAVTRILKMAIRAGRERPFAQALAESERLYLDDLLATDDMAEGLASFLEKRPPVWRHS